MNAKIKILLVDDHTVVLEGLRAVIESQDDLEVVGEASNGREAVRKAKELAPDVVLLDLLMPELNGLGAIQEILKQDASMKVLILSSSDNTEQVRELMDLGAVGYVIKQAGGSELLKAIREARRGNPFLNPSISKRLQQQSRDAFINGDDRNKKTNHLTLRESQVLQLIAEGHSNKMMADTLGLSIKTVEKHRQNLMAKTNIHEVASLTRHAIVTGVIELTPGLPQ